MFCFPVQLDDFRAKRAAGLGNIFGPPDPELKLCDENLEKKMAVINELLVPVLETMAEDLENATDRNSTLCAALATVLHKIFSTKDPKAQSIIDKIPTFVSKEKKKIFGRVLRKNLNINGHNFELKHYDQLTYCNHSQGTIWGIGPQGYRVSQREREKLEEFILPCFSVLTAGLMFTKNLFTKWRRPAWVPPARREARRKAREERDCPPSFLFL